MATNLGQTSGTVGNTVIDVAGIIDHAVRRCGVLTSLITSEQLDSARDNLFFILSGLANRGLSLWCVEPKYVLLNAGRSRYPLPVGTVDVLNAVLSPGEVDLGTTIVATNPTREVELDSPGRLDFVAGYVVTDTLVLIQAEITVDILGVPTPTWVGVTSVTIPAGSVTPEGAVQGVVKVPQTGLQPAAKWRVVAASSSSLLTSVYFVFNTRDVVMTKLSRDAFVSLPDKNTQTQMPLQFWYDKQQYIPEVTFWPAPGALTVAGFYTQRQIQDLGAYTNAVDVPQRWLDAVIAMLAPRVCLELPKELVPPDRYDKLVLIAEKTLREAEDSESDGAPIRLAPRIDCYTR
jgi:hypothetical protein